MDFKTVLFKSQTNGLTAVEDVERDFTGMITSNWKGEWLILPHEIGSKFPVMSLTEYAHYLNSLSTFIEKYRPQYVPKR